MRLSRLLSLALTEYDSWQIAIRPRSGAPLYEGGSAPFTPVPNSLRYWRADPFLFRCNGTDYLFAELYDRFRKKGVLGVTELRNGRCTRWHVCLDLPYHLSYPCVFPCGGELWLVPECYQSGKIMLFRAVDFPLRWERAGAIADCIAADTTPLLRGAKRLEDIRFFTTVFRSARERNNDNLSLLPAFGESPVPVLHSLSTRCAGHFIARGGEILRPVQDCSKIYGGSLLFARVSPGEVYAEQVFLRVLPPDSPAKDGELAVTLERGAHRTYAGIHTYNESDAYEVIDLLIPAHKTLRALLVRLVRRLFFPHSS